MSKISFYAPIKPPDHPIASGDRLIAQNLIKALTIAGHNVNLASRFIAYSKREAGEILQQKKLDALIEANAIIASLRHDVPDLWLTYHPYCKAPDWIGPLVSKALDIPYVNVEAVRTGQGFENGGDRWKSWRIEAQAGIRKADLHLTFKPTDRTYLTELLQDDKNIFDIPPFIDVSVPEKLPTVKHPNHWRPNTPTLVTTGMMRPGKKVKNYKLLATALKPLQSQHWNLVLIGNGPEEKTVREYFSDFDEERLLFTGAISHEEVLAHMGAAELFVWPGWKEPIGVVYMEAQMMGLPVAALRSMGVPLTVYHGDTGLLAEEDDMSGFTENLMQLISHPDLRKDLGSTAKIVMNKRHSLQAGAQALQQALSPYFLDTN